MAVGLSALYGSQPLVVWVEDEATRIALTAAWPGDPVAIHVGGGNDTVRGVVEDAWRGGLTHVFGVVDRDDGRSNIGKWPTPPKDLHVYVLPSPEVETLALDPWSLSECAYNTAARTEAEIEAKLNSIVVGMRWWAACCAVIMQVREKRNSGFPSLPPVERATNAAEALACITSAGWFSTTAATLPGYASPTWLAATLQAEETLVAAAIAAGTWRTAMPGKQVFQRISDFVFTKGSAGVADKHTALLQAVIQQQATAGRLPPELSQLRTSLRGRVGLPP
jgi:hypothetical protein